MCWPEIGTIRPPCLNLRVPFPVGTILLSLLVICFLRSILWPGANDDCGDIDYEICEQIILGFIRLTVVRVMNLDLGMNFDLNGEAIIFFFCCDYGT